MTLQRKTGLRTYKKLERKKKWEYERKPLPKVNHRRKADRQYRYKKYMQSPEWKAIRQCAIDRSGRQCEYEKEVETPYGVHSIRCPQKHRLTVHHKTYARFGGKELPGDLQVLCKHHHEEIEMTKHSHRHLTRRAK